MKSKYIRFFIAVLIGTTVFAFTGGCSGTSSKPENKLPSQQENVTLTVGKRILYQKKKNVTVIETVMCFYNSTETTRW